MPTARGALERWLSTLQVQRYGLPPQAIVAVRQVRAPLRALAGDTANDPLAACLRGAVRPATAGFVGASAGAVWFADEAELLACLAQDAAAGRLAQAWWWPVLLGASASIDTACRRWQASARVVPHALAALAPLGVATRWLTLIGMAGRAGLLDALAVAFPVALAVRDAVVASEAAVGQGFAARPSPGTAHDEAMVRPVARGDTAADGRPAHAPAPIDDAGGTGWPGLAPLRVDAPTALLRLCALLRQAPHRAADPHWAGVIGRLLPDAPRMPPGGGVAGGDGLRDVPIDPAGATPPVGAEAVSAGRREAGPWSAATATAGALPLGLQLAGAVAAQPVRPGPAATRHDTTAPPRNRAAGENIRTGFGGIFFVLNVALAFGLYGDFTQPLHRGLALSPWQLLRAAGRTWRGRRFTADPLAAWLGACAQPAPLPLLPARWRAEPAWLRPFATDARPWHAVLGRDALQLLHPAGFVAARQAPATEADLLALQAAAGHRGALVLHHVPRDARRSNPARRPRAVTCLDMLWPLLAARIALALGLPPRPAVVLLLGLPARVEASAGRVDVRFALASLPLAVRLAGLDRDPGWIPAAGCDLRFHFE